jgi:undecaprenyl-diphosphatase
MSLLRDDLTRRECSDGAVAVNGNAPKIAPWLEKLLVADLAAVRLISGSAQRTLVRVPAIIISKLGNGWIYLILGAVVFASLGSEAIRIAVLGGINAILLHCLYPIIKRRVGRQRPFRADPALRSLLAVLDEHSFPSGHAMTLSGVLVPIVLVWPAAAISSLMLMICMAWSRIATAHHYPSDIFAGTALGVSLAYPLSLCVLSFW